MNLKIAQPSHGCLNPSAQGRRDELILLGGTLVSCMTQSSSSVVFPLRLLGVSSWQTCVEEGNVCLMSKRKTLPGGP